MNLETYQAAGKELIFRLRLPTDPICIKYIKSENEIPETAVRPTKCDQKWSLCQAFTYTRRWGWHCAMTKDDNFCTPATAFHHWANITQDEVIESQVRQGWHKDREAEQQRLNLRLQTFTGIEGESLISKAMMYSGSVCSPLNNTIVEPDTILVFGDGSHITHLVHAISYDYQTPITSSFDGFGETCYKGGLLPFLTGRPQLVLPGMGDRGIAAVQDNELAIGFPTTLLKKVLEHLFKTGGKRNPGQPMRPTIPNNLTESLTPGFKYLREVMDKKVNA